MSLFPLLLFLTLLTLSNTLETQITPIGETASSDPILTLPIQFPSTLTSFNIYQNSNIEFELNKFKETYNLSSSEYSQLNDTLRKQILLYGKLPYQRVIIGSPKLLNSCVSPQYTYLINPSVVPLNSIVLEINSECDYITDSQNGVDVDVFLQYVRICYGFEGGWSFGVNVDLGFKNIIYYNPTSPTTRAFKIIPSKDHQLPLQLEGSRNCLLIKPNEIVYNVFYDIIKMVGCGKLVICEVLGEGECTQPIINNLKGEIVVLGVHNLIGDTDFFPEGTIMYNFEQVNSQESKLNSIDIFKNSRYKVWDYSTSNIKAFKELGIEAELNSLSYSSTLKFNLPSVEKDIDVLFYGTVTPYRRKIINNLRVNGLKAYVVTDVTWGVYYNLLNSLINRSKIVLVLNTFKKEGEWKISRLGRLLANEVFVVVERNGGFEEGGFEDGAGWCEEEWVECVGKWLGDEEGRGRVGMEGGRIWRGEYNE